MQTAWGLTWSSIHWVQGVFPGEKVARVPSPLPNPEVKNDWTYASTPLRCCHGLDREDFTSCNCVNLHDFHVTVTLLNKQVTEIKSSAHCSFIAENNKKLLLVFDWLIICFMVFRWVCPNCRNLLKLFVAQPWQFSAQMWRMGPHHGRWGFWWVSTLWCVLVTYAPRNHPWPFWQPVYLSKYYTGTPTG